MAILGILCSSLLRGEVEFKTVSLEQPYAALSMQELP